MTRIATWMLAGMVAAGAGYVTTPPARADDGTPPPAATVEQEQRAIEAALAAEADAQRAGGEGRKAAAEVRATLHASGLGGNGVNVFARKTKKEKAAYLGVSTSSVPGSLREQMKLQRGFGLVVDTVEETSGAGEAGILQFDILQKLNDQLLINTQQLSVLVRSMKPGEKVAVTILRGGQPMNVDVTLKEKELPVLGESSGGMTFDAPLAEWSGQFKFPEIEELRMAPNGTANLTRIFSEDDAAEGSSVYSDSEMTLTVTSKDDDKTLVAKDAQGTTLYDGPIATEEQKKALPAKVAEKLAKFESRIEKIKGDGKNIRVRVIEP